MRGPATARCWRRRKRSTSCGCAMARISPARRRPSATARPSRWTARARPSIRPGMCSAPRRSRSRRNGLRIVASGDYKDVADPTCAPFELVPCDVFITEATFGLPVFRHGDPDGEIAKLLHSVSLFPERAHLVGAYSPRQGAARDRADPQGRLRQADLSARRDGDDDALLRALRHRSRRLAPGARRQEGRTCRHHHALPAVGAEGSLVAPLPRSGRRRFASGWMRVRARARQRVVELPLVISDHADWDGLSRDHRRDRRRRNLGDARRRRMRWSIGAASGAEGATARHRRLWRRGRDRWHHRRGDDAKSAARRHEPLRRIARPPVLRTRPQQQAAADDGLFPPHARSGPRLCARPRSPAHCRFSMPSPT